MSHNTGELSVVPKNDIVDHEYIPFSDVYTDQEGNTMGGTG